MPIQIKNIDSYSLYTNSNTHLLKQADLYYNEVHFKIGKYDNMKTLYWTLIKNMASNSNCVIQDYLHKK